MSAEFSRPEYDAGGEKILTRAGDSVNDSMMNISVYRMSPGEIRLFCYDSEEMAALLILGSVTFRWSGKSESGERRSFIEEGPYLLHVPRGVAVTLEAKTESEVLIQRTANDRAFEPVFYTPADCREDIFGEGVLEGKLERTVRTVFDYSNAPYSNMVNGEVINHQGGWSSYTPHHHPQPEVYYYRYERPEGFGACFLGEKAYKIEDGCVAAIPGGVTHPQVTAPAFPMYYCWMIRHLPNAPWRDRIVDERYSWIDAKMK